MLWFCKPSDCGSLRWLYCEDIFFSPMLLSPADEKSKFSLGENCALAANKSVDCRATTLFTIGLNSAKVWNRGFNWPVFSVLMHKKSPNVCLNNSKYCIPWTQMEKYTHRRNVILGIIKVHYNIVKTRPSNVNCGNINAITLEPIHA